MKKLTMLLTAILICSVNASFAHQRIDFIPKPLSVEYCEGSFNMDKNLSISGGDKWNVDYLKEHLDRCFDFDVQKSDSGSIQLLTVPGLGPEAYRMDVSEKGIVITSSTKAGEFYAIQTLLQMMPSAIYRNISNKEDGLMLKKWSVPSLKITDEPRFPYRGSMFDVSRTFFSKEFMLRHLDFLAYHKINKLHWHLVDDNGWRIEIKKYPKLTQVGAWRGKECALPPAYNSGPDAYGGYYTQADIKEIVKYASERNIEIIPEIDLPGHSKSIAVSYPEILCKHDVKLQSVQGEVQNVFCVGNEANYKMLDNIFKEIASLFNSEYINIGGDEVATENWKYCPECQAVMKKMGFTDEHQLLGYFVSRLDKIVKKHGKKMGGWHDIVVGDIDNESLVVAWKSKNAKDAINKGFKTVMQPAEYCYLDMKQSIEERGHTWASIVSLDKIYSFDPTGTFPLTEEQKNLVVGPQAGLWTEMLFFPPHFADYQQFPRLCALAEIGWTPQDQREFKDFEARLDESHIDRLYNMGIKFRIPRPEISLSNVTYSSDSDCPDCVVSCKASVEAPYPNMVVRYSTDGTEPDVNSPVVTSSVFTDNPSSMRFATFYNDIKSITVEIPGCRAYLKPATKVETSFTSNSWSSKENLEKYDFSKYMRTSELPKKGDYVLYTFDSPVTCSRITVQTNDPVNQFFGITEGHAEYSYDGENFINAGDFDINNRVIITTISAPVKAVKIVVDGECEQKQVSIQCLKIEK